MPAADQTRVLKRVTEILNLCDPAAYSAVLSTRNKTRNATAIADFVTEAGLHILRTIGETAGNEYRGALVTEVTGLSSGQLLPEHQGNPVYVEIQPYTGAGWMQGDRRDYRKIQSWRENKEEIYDTINHNEEDSTLTGYFDVWEKKFYFTGNAARIGLVQIARTDVATKVPEIFENTWIKLSVGQSAKSGTGNYDMNMVNFYGNQGMNDLLEFKNGKRQFPEVSDPEPTSAVHP